MSKHKLLIILCAAIFVIGLVGSFLLLNRPHGTWIEIAQDSHGTQCGDPDKGANLVIEAIDSETPSFKFTLGNGAWEVYKQREAMQNEKMKTWLNKSRQTAFDV